MRGGPHTQKGKYTLKDGDGGTFCFKTLKDQLSGEFDLQVGSLTLIPLPSALLLSQPGQPDPHLYIPHHWSGKPGNASSGAPSVLVYHF